MCKQVASYVNMLFAYKCYVNHYVYDNVKGAHNISESNNYSTPIWCLQLYSKLIQVFTMNIYAHPVFHILLMTYSCLIYISLSDQNIEIQQWHFYSKKQDMYKGLPIGVTFMFSQANHKVRSRNENNAFPLGTQTSNLQVKYVPLNFVSLALKGTKHISCSYRQVSCFGSSETYSSFI